MSDEVEDHVILRVPKELVERVQAVVKPKDGKPEAIEIVGDEGNRNVVFKIGEDSYYATLRDLPTVVETMKTKKMKDSQDSGVFYKSADVAQVLEVSNVKIDSSKPRPTVSPDLDDGLTPPMHKARSERFKRLDRAIKHGLPQPEKDKDSKDSKDSKEKDKNARKAQDLVQRMDAELYDIVENLSKGKGEMFVHEELIDLEPFMEYWDTKTVIKQGADNFLTESRLAYDLAWEKYQDKVGRHNAGKSGGAARPVGKGPVGKGPAGGAGTSKRLTTQILGVGELNSGLKTKPATGSTSANSTAAAAPAPAPKVSTLERIVARAAAAPAAPPAPSPPASLSAAPAPSPTESRTSSGPTSASPRPSPAMTDANTDSGLTPTGAGSTPSGATPPAGTPSGLTPPPAASPGATPSGTPGAMPQPSPSPSASPEASPAASPDANDADTVMTPEIAAKLKEVSELRKQTHAARDKAKGLTNQVRSAQNKVLKNVYLGQYKTIKAEYDALHKKLRAAQQELEELKAAAQA